MGNLGEPAANGEGWGRSYCIVPNKSAELAAQESSLRKALKTEVRWKKETGRFH